MGEHVTGPYEGQPKPPLEVVVVTRQLINIGLLPIALDKISKYRCCFKVYEHKKDVSLLMRLICKSELEAMQRVKELQSKYKEAYS